MHKFDIRNIDKLDNPKRRKVLPPEETLIRFGVEDICTYKQCST